MATGDYIACVSNDTRLVKGSLRDLCVPNTVTSPTVENQKNIKDFAGSFFVVPRNIYQKIGMLDERMKIFYSDEDYKRRLLGASVPLKMVETVIIHHLVGQTVGNSQHPEDKGVYDSIYQ
jgi:GT2 family glycosyltransferase